MIYYLQKIGQGHEVQFSKLNHSMANVKFYKCLQHTLRQLLTFQRYKNFKFCPSKIGQGHRVQFSQANYAMANVKIYKCLPHIFASCYRFKDLKIRPVRTILTDTHTHRHTHTHRNGQTNCYRRNLADFPKNVKNDVFCRFWHAPWNGVVVTIFYSMTLNSLARVVTCAKPRAESFRLLIDLHWLPIKHRIDFKMATITFKIQSAAEPSYLASLLSYYVPGRALRSADLHLLHIPLTKTVICSRAFRSAAPKIWNYLPADIRSEPSLLAFRCKLKTFHFKLALANST